MSRHQAQGKKMSPDLVFYPGSPELGHGFSRHEQDNHNRRRQPDAEEDPSERRAGAALASHGSPEHAEVHVQHGARDNAGKGGCNEMAERHSSYAKK
jgi:hypothetical protein